MQELVVRLNEFALDQGPEILIASAVAVAGTFGIGGRERAAETLNGWRQKMEKEKGLSP